MLYRLEKVIDDGDWDDLVRDTYGKPYRFQQQDGCKERQRVRITIPDEEVYDYLNDTVPEEVNHFEMGVSFKAWLERSPEKPLEGASHPHSLSMWWERNFYPDVQMVANDLYEKGLIEAGEYVIDIDW